MPRQGSPPADAEELEPGQRVADRYVILDRLGAGGMGQVFRARDTKLERDVALKTVLSAHLADPTARERLMREARGVAALQHSGIVQVHDVGELENGGAFLVMELIRGRTPRQAAHERPLDFDEVGRVVEELAETLCVAHRAGLIHRDIKPDNIMLRDDGRVVLLDFGLVKSVVLPNADTHTPSAEKNLPARSHRGHARLPRPGASARAQHGRHGSMGARHHGV